MVPTWECLTELQICAQNCAQSWAGGGEAAGQGRLLVTALLMRLRSPKAWKHLQGGSSTSASLRAFGAGPSGTSASLLMSISSAAEGCYTFLGWHPLAHFAHPDFPYIFLSLAKHSRMQTSGLPAGKRDLILKAPCPRAPPPPVLGFFLGKALCAQRCRCNPGLDPLEHLHSLLCSIHFCHCIRDLPVRILKERLLKYTLAELL